MTSAENMATRLSEAATEAQSKVLSEAARSARDHNLPLYLVGGAVRDLLMERPLKDLDLSVEGSATPLSDSLVAALEGQVVMRSQFGTCKLSLLGVAVDIAIARKETYQRPGALPTVTPDSISADLLRRDFTINSMAIRLTPEPTELLDPTGGRQDVAEGLIRILHSNSFRDDATRILRAIRYEQRLGFHLEPHTEALLKRDLSYVGAITGDRIRRELDLMFHEACTPATLLRASELGVLRAIHPALPDLPTLQHLLARLATLDTPHPLSYFAILTYDLDKVGLRSLAARLNLPKSWADVMKDTLAARKAIAQLTPGQRPSHVYHQLSGLSSFAIQMAGIMTNEAETRQLAWRYLDEWQHVRPMLNGDDLMRLGVPRGPKVRETLEALRRARLDGRVTSKEEEVDWVRVLLKGAAP